jgi:hypothetical protein
MSKITINYKVADRGLAEIYQSMNLQMAILNKDSPTSYTKITPFVKCRDFMCDVFSFSKAKKDFAIYGMSFAGSKETPDMSGVYLLIKFPNAAAKKDFFKNLRHIRQIEDQNGYKPTTVLCEGFLDDKAVKNGHHLVIGDKRWLQNAMSYSLYTFLLRVMCYPIPNHDDPDTFYDVDSWVYEVAKQSTSDGKYVASIPLDTWEAVLLDLSKLKTDAFCGLDPHKHSVGEIHHNSGFISVFGHHSEISPATVKKNEHWKEMQARGLKTKIV